MLRIGAVSYLNTKPLIYGLAERLEGVGQLSLNLPSRLAEDLALGRLEVALIPSIEYFRGVGTRIVSDAAIACHGPVWSVRLLSRVPMGQIKRLALDEGSRTSAALAKILLYRCHGLKPESITLPMESTPEQMDADAILLIGDRAMHPPADTYAEIWDLGDRWCELTGLPFVFAMWVARSGIDTVNLGRILEVARDEGLAHLSEISATEAGPHGLTTSDLSRYFSQHLQFQLEAKQWEGLRLYRQYAEELGLLQAPQANMLWTCGH